MRAVPTAFNSVLVAMRIIILENLSTITRTALYPCDSGSGPIRSIEMCSQGFEGIACGLSWLCGFSRWFLVVRNVYSFFVCDNSISMVMPVRVFRLKSYFDGVFISFGFYLLESFKDGVRE